MDINRFTEKLKEAIHAAQSKAVRYSHQQIDVEHLLRALLEQDGGLARRVADHVRPGRALERHRRRRQVELGRIGDRDRPAQRDQVDAQVIGALGRLRARVGAPIPAHRDAAPGPALPRGRRQLVDRRPRAVHDRERHPARLAQPEAHER